MQRNFFNLPAPAKLNLFLHVVGRREDGMHLIQSFFQLIDLCDFVSLEELPGAEIAREGDISWEVEKDLAYRAAKLLQGFAPEKGVRITVAKYIPDGAGLGGGSSDAATTLIGLNRLWNLNLPQKKLMELGETLGADVPFFIGGMNAFVEGIGEKITPFKSPEKTFVLLKPEESLSTKEIFTDPHLTRNTPLCKIALSSDGLEIQTDLGWSRNDLQPVAISRCPKLKEMFEVPEFADKIRMTGSGTVCFYTVKSDRFHSVPENLPDSWKHWVVSSLDEHPLLGWMKPLENG